MVGVINIFISTFKIDDKYTKDLNKFVNRIVAVK